MASLLQQETLHAHNSVRALEGKPSLQWCDICAGRAQAWADQLAAKQELRHSAFDPSHPSGQNIAMGGKNFTVSKAVVSWCNERDYYRHGSDYHQPGTGHYTQCVWRSTTGVGTGIARRCNQTYVVCNYCEPGNCDGQYARNV
jgi:uncharacterized protein YkwD